MQCNALDPRIIAGWGGGSFKEPAQHSVGPIVNIGPHPQRPITASSAFTRTVAIHCTCNIHGARRLCYPACLDYAPRPQKAKQRMVSPEEERVTAFVFEIQANMDPKHRDRVAFIRLCPGHFHRGMKLLHVHSGNEMPIHNPMFFLAQDREIVDEAVAGDILGIPPITVNCASGIR